jgi:mannose-1-phosphate guanylyltransferase
VTAFLEKTPHPVTNQINAGCYVFRREVIDEIPPGVVTSVERETFPALIADDAVVMGYLDSSYWLDVGTPGAFVQGSRDLVLGRLASPALAPRLVACPVRCLLLDGARVDQGAWAGGGTVVGPGSVIEAGARVDGSVLFDGVRVGAGARVSASVLGRGARIGESVVLDEAVIGDDVSVASGNELRAGMRVWPGVDLGPTSVRFSTDA